MLTFASRERLEGRTSLGYGSFREATVAVSATKDGKPLGTLTTRSTSAGGLGHMEIGFGADLLAEAGTMAEIDVDLNRGFHVTGWVPKSALKVDKNQESQKRAKISAVYPDEPLRGGFGMLGSRRDVVENRIYRKCRSPLPLWGAAPPSASPEERALVQFGHVKAERPFAGALDANGDLLVDLLGFEVRESGLWGSLRGADAKPPKKPKVPLVPKEALAAATCDTLTAEDYEKELRQP